MPWHVFAVVVVLGALFLFKLFWPMPLLALYMIWAFRYDWQHEWECPAGHFQSFSISRSAYCSVCGERKGYRAKARFKCPLGHKIEGEYSYCPKCGIRMK